MAESGMLRGNRDPLLTGIHRSHGHLRGHWSDSRSPSTSAVPPYPASSLKECWLPSATPNDYVFSSRAQGSSKILRGWWGGHMKGCFPLRVPPGTLSPLQPMEANSTLAVFVMKTRGRTPALPRMKWVWMKISPPSSSRTRLERHVSGPLALWSSLSCPGVLGGQGEWTNSPEPQPPTASL